MTWFVKSYHRHRKPPIFHNIQLLLLLLYICCCALKLPLTIGETLEQGTVQDYRDGDDTEPDTTTEENNSTDGQYLGSACDDVCDPKLHHVFCDQVTHHCECDKKYPVKLGPTRGCAKPVRLGDQCFYGQACAFYDPNAACIQILHNAICQCRQGYHIVAVARPTKRVFCSEDLLLLTSDLPTLFGVATGIALFTGLICFVLKLFSSARYTRPRHYANANLAPPILFSSDTGIPLALQGGRPSSRSSQRSCGTLASSYSRRASSGGSRGVLVPASRAGAARAAAILLISCQINPNTPMISSTLQQLPLQSYLPGEMIDDDDDDDSTIDDEPQHDVASTSLTRGSRRPSLASIHSNASSQRSFSMRRFERENQQREQRQQQIQDNLRLSTGCRDREATASMPSPKTPMSTDELLPSVSEGEEGYSMPVLGTGTSHTASVSVISTGYQGEIGPCTSSDQH